MHKIKIGTLLAGIIISASATASSTITERVKIGVRYDDSSLCKALKHTPGSSIDDIEKRLKDRLRLWVTWTNGFFYSSRASASIYTSSDAIQYRYLAYRNHSGNLPPSYFKDRNPSKKSAWISWCNDTHTKGYTSADGNNSGTINGHDFLVKMQKDQELEGYRIETRSDIVSQVSAFKYHSSTKSKKGIGGKAIPFDSKEYIPKDNRNNTAGHNEHGPTFSFIRLFDNDANLNIKNSRSENVLSFAHELGHNFGLKHSEQQDRSATPLIDFAWGYGKKEGFSGFATIMTYPDVFGVPNRSPFFSNPDINKCRINQKRVPCGTERANSVNGINKTAFILSKYKSDKVKGEPIEQGLFFIKSKSGAYIGYPGEAPVREEERPIFSKSSYDRIATTYIREKNGFLLTSITSTTNHQFTRYCLSEVYTRKLKWVECNEADDNQTWQFIEDEESYFYIKSNDGNYLESPNYEGQDFRLSALENTSNFKFINHPVTRENKLVVDDKLDTNQRIYSPNREYFLAMQGDGNLVIYNKQYTPIWYTATGGSNKTFAVLQSDGNFVVHDPNSGRTLWSTRTGGSRVYAELDNSGRFKIKTKSGSVLWQSH